MILYDDVPAETQYFSVSCSLSCGLLNLLTSSNPYPVPAGSCQAALQMANEMPLYICRHQWAFFDQLLHIVFPKMSSARNHQAAGDRWKRVLGCVGIYTLVTLRESKYGNGKSSSVVYRNLRIATFDYHKQWSRTLRWRSARFLQVGWSALHWLKSPIS
jgi:hypothetical protein